MVGIGQVLHLNKTVAIVLPQCNHADVLDQCRQECFVGITTLHNRSEGSSSAGGIDAPSPIIFKVKENFLLTFECLRKTETKHQTFDGLETEISQGLTNTSHSLGESVEARVNRLQDSGRDGGVVLDRLRNLPEFHVPPTGQFQHPDCHGWKRGQLGTLHDPRKSGVVHLLLLPANA